jgi:hypothetical protein
MFTDSMTNWVVRAMFWHNKSINILDVVLEYTAFVLQALKSYTGTQWKKSVGIPKRFVMQLTSLSALLSMRI